MLIWNRKNLFNSVYPKQQLHDLFISFRRMIDVERRRNKIIQFKSVKSCRECVVRLIIIMFTEKDLGLTNDVVKHVINRISEIYISLNIWYMVFIQLVVCFLCPLQSSRIKNTCNVKIINHRKTLEILFYIFVTHCKVH